MPILRERVAWSRLKAPRGADLTPDEQGATKTALAFLLRRFGTWPALAAAMGLKQNTLRYAAGKRGSVTAGVALRAARAAGVPLEDVLSGRWPTATMCPHCGRG